MNTSTSGWHDDAAPGQGIARIRLRNDADRTEIEKHDPLDLLPAGTIYDCIELAAGRSPDKIAIRLAHSGDPMVSSDLTYAQLIKRLRQAACLFTETAGSETPVVTVIAPLHPDGLIATWAAETVGIVNPINPFLDVAGLTGLMNAAGTNILVIGCKAFGPGAWDKLDEITAGVPSLRRVFVIGDDTDARDFHAAVAAQSTAGFDSLKRRGGGEVATYMPTGGTTGAPKMVKHTQNRQLINAWLMGALMGAQPNEVVGQGMPHFHVGGLVAAALRAMIYDQTLVLLTPEGFRNAKVVGNFWAVMKHYGITNIIATPATAAAILGAPGDGHEGHNIHTFACGGSTIPVELLRAFHKRFGIYLRELWGMTEFHGVSTGHPNDGTEPAIGSVGRRFAFHEVKVVKLDADRYAGEMPLGEKGILVVKSICVGDGYVNTEKNSDLFVQGMPDGEVWASTGDIGSMDGDGHIWVHGREKDLIVRGGHNIDPKVIEEALQAHPAVQLSAAIGRPDPQRGEMPTAYVQLRPGASATEEELLTLCKQTISERAAVPVEIRIIDAIPMTAVGKIAKPTLRIDATNRVAHEVVERIAGTGSARRVDTDNSGKRTIVTLDVAAPHAQRDHLREALNKAFLSYEFGIDLNFVDP